MTHPLTIRAAMPEEHAAIEALFVKASLANEGDRAFLLASPSVRLVPQERATQGHFS